jgi:hypothetical protein
MAAALVKTLIAPPPKMTQGAFLSQKRPPVATVWSIIAQTERSTQTKSPAKALGGAKSKLISQGAGRSRRERPHLTISKVIRQAEFWLFSR